MQTRTLIAQNRSLSFAAEHSYCIWEQVQDGVQLLLLSFFIFEACEHVCLSLLHSIVDSSINVYNVN